MRPQPFGRYLLLDRISSGGMAEVFLAKTQGVRGFEKVVAIKRILPLVAEDLDFQTMFMDEAQISAHLTHANVAQVFDSGKIENQFYIAMEYVAGRDLRALRTRLAETGRHMPVNMALHVAARVCQGLDYAHRQKTPDGRSMEIIHRDVSPPNILVSYEGQVKIIDFGIAKAASRSTRTRAGKLKGKFAYMSPEQVEGGQLDHRSDIFAVGIVLYEMLTNRRPFEGDNQLATLNLVRRAETDPPSTVNPEVPLEVDRIVARALMRKPDERYGWASEMRADIERYFGRTGEAFETHHLADWMKQEFAGEIEAERRLMQRISQLQLDDDEGVKAPAVDGGASRRGRDARDLTPAVGLEEGTGAAQALAPTESALALLGPGAASEGEAPNLAPTSLGRAKATERPPVTGRERSLPFTGRPRQLPATGRHEPLPVTGRHEPLPATGRRAAPPEEPLPKARPSGETVSDSGEQELDPATWSEPTTLDEGSTSESPALARTAIAEVPDRQRRPTADERRTSAWAAPGEEGDDGEARQTSQREALVADEDLEEDLDDAGATIDDPAEGSVDELPMGKTTILHRGADDEALAHLPTMAIAQPPLDEPEAVARTKILSADEVRKRRSTGARPAAAPVREHRGGAQTSGVVETLDDDYEELEPPPSVAPRRAARPRERTDRVGKEGRKPRGRQDTAVSFGEGLRRALSRLTSTQIVVLVASATLVIIGIGVLVVLVVADGGESPGGGEGTGSLIITSSPPAACTVGLDDRPKGLLSPGASMSLAGVPSGPHTVSLTCVGYRPFSRATQVNPAQVTLVEAHLQKE